MNYEEKYKQALERASKLRVQNPFDTVGQMVEHIFPELKESEDKRIREELLDYLKRFIPHTDIDLVKKSKSWIAWLEKQGEENIIDLKEYAKGILKGAAIHLMVWIDENLADGNMCLSNMECEDLEDAMVNAKWDKIYNYIKKKVGKKDEQKPAWSEEDERLCQETIDWFEKKCFPYALENENPARESIKWLKSLKDRVQPQPKQEWNEKDNIRLDHLIGLIQKYGLEYYASIDKVIDFIHWLKSLKPNHWKPSEQNIKDLEWCADLVKDKMGVGFHRLQIFIDELKTL